MKRRLLITLVLLLLCIGGIGWFSYMQQKTVVLKFGMFAGSNWDVPNGDSYKIIDQAIERFEKAHPNVRVEYVSGLQKADYSEWLSQQALEGDLPDVYMVLSDDLYTFADIGMLEELDSYIPVSYTHLDVYKRQMYMRLKRTQGIFLHYPYEIIAFMRHIIHRVTFSTVSYLFALST